MSSEIGTVQRKVTSKDESKSEFDTFGKKIRGLIQPTSLITGPIFTKITNVAQTTAAAHPIIAVGLTTAAAGYLVNDYGEECLHRKKELAEKVEDWSKDRFHHRHHTEKSPLKIGAERLPMNGLEQFGSTAAYIPEMLMGIPSEDRLINHVGEHDDALELYSDEMNHRTDHDIRLCSPPPSPIPEENIVGDDLFDTTYGWQKGTHGSYIAKGVNDSVFRVFEVSGEYRIFHYLSDSRRTLACSSSTLEEAIALVEDCIRYEKYLPDEQPFLEQPEDVYSSAPFKGNSCRWTIESADSYTFEGENANDFRFMKYTIEKSDLFEPTYTVTQQWGEDSDTVTCKTLKEAFVIALQCMRSNKRPLDYNGSILTFDDCTETIITPQSSEDISSLSGNSENSVKWIKESDDRYTLEGENDLNFIKYTIEKSDSFTPTYSVIQQWGVDTNIVTCNTKNEAFAIAKLCIRLNKRPLNYSEGILTFDDFTEIRTKESIPLTNQEDVPLFSGKNAIPSVSYPSTSITDTSEERRKNLWFDLKVGFLIFLMIGIWSSIFPSTPAK